MHSLAIEDFLRLPRPILDVRSPGEFARGHIPGAVNLPLFTDEERALVGTVYKQQGRDAAVLVGLRAVGPRMAAMVERASVVAPDRNVRVHCWRGGERSGSVGWLLDKAGFVEVATLRKGYKGFRAHVHQSFGAQLQLRVLGGYTGTGKTETLGYMKALGAQVVDLEALAHHKGSSFGAIGELPQPSTEQFENLLWHALQQVDPTRPVWVEDESMMVGRAKIPDAFFNAMRSAPLAFAEMPIEQRADRLVKDYGRFPVEELAAATKRIEKRMGPQHCKAALDALAAGDLRSTAVLALGYYDKTYAFGLGKRDATCVMRFPADANDLRGLAERLMAYDHG
ncbi:MAG: tRNA 2-selenouridine(34) synthase MnmH [Flavobacteriales bacterium]|nr:MAG: tRNA 2-selenouridine(34) synthase MnmH [Flavobacteriales bacterium]